VGGEALVRRGQYQLSTGNLSEGRPEKTGEISDIGVKQREEGGEGADTRGTVEAAVKKKNHG